MRGSVSPLVAIILGIIVLFIVLGLFGKPLYDTASGFFKGLGGAREAAVGTVQEGPDLPRFVLRGSKDEMKSALVNLLLDCWKHRDSDEFECYIVEFDVPGETNANAQSREARSIDLGDWQQALTREEVSEEVARRGQAEAAESLNNPSSWQKVRRQSPIALGIRTSSGAVIRPMYKICVDDDVTGDELFLADTLGVECE